MLYRVFFSLLLIAASGVAMALGGGPSAPQAGAIPRATNTTVPTFGPLPTVSSNTPAPYPAPDDDTALAERVSQFDWDELPLYFSAFGAPGLPPRQWWFWVRAAPGQLDVTLTTPAILDYRSAGTVCTLEDGGTRIRCQIAADAPQPSGVLVQTDFEVRADALLTTAAGVERATWPRPPLTTGPTPAPTAPPAPMPVRLIAIPVFR